MGSRMAQSTMVLTVPAFHPALPLQKVGCSVVVFFFSCGRFGTIHQAFTLAKLPVMATGSLKVAGAAEARRFHILVGSQKSSSHLPLTGLRHFSSQYP